MLDLVDRGSTDSGGFELIFEPLLLEVLANDDEQAFSLFVSSPLLVGNAGEEHADAVEDELVFAALDSQESFHPIDICTFFFKDFHEKLVCSFLSNFRVHLIRESSDSRVMLVLIFIFQNFLIDLQGAFYAEGIQI